LPILSLDGFFFDQTPYTQSVFESFGGSGPYVTYIQSFVNYAASTVLGTGAFYWLNTSVWPDTPNALNPVPGVQTGIILENDYADWLTNQVASTPSWATQFDGHRIATIVHDCSETQMTQGLTIAAGINSNTVYFSDGTGINPYTVLPSYWQTENNLINQGGY
jgi:hypothetical protein